MKKVFQLITRLDKGGSAELVLQTCKELAKQGFDVTLGTGKTIDPPFDILDYAKVNNFNLVELKHLVRNVNPISDILAYREIKKVLKRLNPDILHTNTSKAGFIGRIAGHSAQINKIFHSPHGHIFYGYYSRAITNIFILMERIAARFSTKIFNLTERGRQDHIEKRIGLPEKFEVSSCGIDLAEFMTDKPKSLSKEKTKILWVGRFVPIKNPEMAIEVAKILSDENIKLRLIGDGELLRQSKEMINKKSLNNIELPGFITGLKKEFSDADIFIITSLNEGFGRVIVEAMAAGLPVIATKVGGIPELVKDNENGFLVDSNDANKMAEKIQYLLDNHEKYAEISLNNLKKSRHYSLENYIANITKHY